MPRFPTAFLADLKTAVPCERLLEARGVELRRAGADLVGRCPLPGHDDETPSFRISAKDGKSLWHCLGACGTGGDVINLVQRLDECGFTEAVSSLASLAGLPLPEPERSTARPVRRCPVVLDARLFELARQVVDAYHAQLLKPRNAGRAYLASRGLDDPAVIDHFRIGFAERGVLGKQIPNKQRAAGAAVRAELEALGWFNAPNGHEALAGSIVVPLFDGDGCAVSA
jgi:DNA primase